MQNVKLFFPCHSEPAEESPNINAKPIIQGDAITTLTLVPARHKINAKFKMQKAKFDRKKIFPCHSGAFEKRDRIHLRYNKKPIIFINRSKEKYENLPTM